QLEAAAKLGADIVEFHVGPFCDATAGDVCQVELDKILNGAAIAEELGLECHAGHGITFDTVAPIAQIPNVVELNIGHFLIGEAIFIGLEAAIEKMRRLMDEARNSVSIEG
ncbi:MAG: pyridoxine 5'-phosphate synthase, partial [Sneathiella sp.]|nr:pyridoxine 5'-phosphate synthase [Sneathiella sp.]